jgi:hypothetical protein
VFLLIALRCWPENPMAGPAIPNWVSITGLRENSSAGGQKVFFLFVSSSLNFLLDFLSCKNLLCTAKSRSSDVIHLLI